MFGPSSSTSAYIARLSRMGDSRIGLHGKCGGGRTTIRGTTRSRRQNVEGFLSTILPPLSFTFASNITIYLLGSDPSGMLSGERRKYKEKLGAFRPLAPSLSATGFACAF